MPFYLVWPRLKISVKKNMVKQQLLHMQANKYSENNKLNWTSGSSGVTLKKKKKKSYSFLQAQQL